MLKMKFVNKLKTRKEQMQHLENTGSASEKAQASKEIDKLNAMIADSDSVISSSTIISVFFPILT